MTVRGFSRFFNKEITNILHCIKALLTVRCYIGNANLKGENKYEWRGKR